MGKRTLVHIRKYYDGTYQWEGKNAECCIMAVHSNSWVSDIDLQEYVKHNEITQTELSSILKFDDGRAKEKDFEIIKKLAERLQLKIVIHEIKDKKVDST